MTIIVMHRELNTNIFASLVSWLLLWLLSFSIPEPNSLVPGAVGIKNLPCCKYQCFVIFC